MYKLIAIDLDGTMLNQYGAVTENTKKAIKKIQEKGTEVIIASGRPIDSIKTIAKEIQSEKYFISGNGAILYDIKKQEIIYENTLKKSKVLDIIKICEENSIFYTIYTPFFRQKRKNSLFYFINNRYDLLKMEEHQNHYHHLYSLYIDLHD